MSFGIRKGLGEVKGKLSKAVSALKQSGIIIGLERKFFPEKVESKYVKEYCQRQAKTHIRVHKYGQIHAVLEDFLSIFILLILCLVVCWGVFLVESVYTSDGVREGIEDKKPEDLGEEINRFFLARSESDREEFRRLFYYYRDLKQ